MQNPNPETVTLNDILITEELSRRAPRSPNLQAENQAMRMLIHQMTHDTESLIQTLVDTALELCQAGTTGLSLLETAADGEEIFRWKALAGTLAHYVGGSTPRNFSPCGVCLDQGIPVLFSHPEHYFTYFQKVNTPIVEGFVLPLVADSHVFGTIWIMSHNEQRQFDAEDVRIMTSLADFTATALLLQQRQTGELLAANAVLETEIVERKQVEAQTHALIANLPGGAVFVVDRDLRYLLAEGEAFSAAGFKPGDFVGRTIFEVLPPDLAASYEPMYRQALAGEPFEHEHNAHNHTYLSRGTPLRTAPRAEAELSPDGEVYAVLTVSFDITERKRIEAAIRKSETKYRSLFSSIDEGCHIIELIDNEAGEVVDYRFLEDNPALERLTGLKNTAGKLGSEIAPNTESYWIEVYDRVARTGEPLRIENYSGDTQRWYSAYAFRIGEPQERKVAVLFNDITDRTWATVERARAEAALRELEIQRVREQSAREQERQRAESLAELDRAKTSFFSNISHEFRTPLTLLLAPLQDALRSVEAWERGSVGAWERHGVGKLGSRRDAITPSTLKEPLHLAHRNALRLLKLVNTLLDFSRIEAGRMEAVYEPTDLATFTTELASVFRSAIERAGLQLIVDCPPLPEPVFVDREMWEKIVLNLLSNAFKFTFEGEIRVSLYSTDRNQVILQVQDTGTGIAPEHLPHLFERFYQVRGTQARTHDGSGIGLALVHELVRLQGGTIEVSSNLEEGTCFTIVLLFGIDHLPSDRLQDEGDRNQPTRTLASTAMGATTYVEEAERWFPTIDPPQSPLKRGENLLKIPLNKGDLGGASELEANPTSSRVLVVDDNADMREYLTRILSDHVQVEAVADGVTALAVAQARVPDLILSDVMMPGLDGFELLETLRADPRTREVPIILLSARAGEEAIVEGLEAGADDYLIKPFSAQELISRVTAHLQMAQLRREALQEARSTIRSRDEFISVVSHELNTPLVSILGWTRMLRSSPPNLVMLSKALDTIERNATLQGKLVQDLLDLSRISAGKLRLNPQPIELKSVIETAIATGSQSAADKGINLTWQGAVTEVVVMGDSDRLGQVVCNLLTNAIKFTPESGSVRVELSVMNDHGSANASYAEIRVTDTGIGIAADFLPHVFDRFRQAEGAHLVKGLGLGLAIARHIVELHSGTIHAESAGEKQGSTFIVRLPLLQNRDDLI
jgi:signal transduction histidine kinase